MRRLLPLALAVAAATGCAATRRPPGDLPPRAPAEEIPRQSGAEPPAGEPPADSKEAQEGVFHIVQPGQTLWRIARAYGVSLETIAQANGIADPGKVAVGTPVFIPGANMTLEVAPWPAPPPGAASIPNFHSVPSSDFLWPVSGGELMRPFGEPRRHHVHAGIDIRGSAGEDILSARDGTVVFSGPTRGGYGNMVVVDHGGGIETVYAHAQQVLVKPGDTVRRGDRLALVGRTGNATTEHCHFELRRADRPVDPMPFFVSTTEARRR